MSDLRPARTRPARIAQTSRNDELDLGAFERLRATCSGPPTTPRSLTARVAYTRRANVRVFEPGTGDAVTVYEEDPAYAFRASVDRAQPAVRAFCRDEKADLRQHGATTPVQERFYDQGWRVTLAYLVGPAGSRFKDTHQLGISSSRRTSSTLGMFCTGTGEPVTQRIWFLDFIRRERGLASPG